MVSANDLDRSGNLIQSCVVESRVQDLKRVEKCYCLFRRYPSLPFAHQQCWHQRPLAGQKPVEHTHGRVRLFVREGATTKSQKHRRRCESRTRLVAQLADRPTAQRKAMGLAKTLKPPYGLDYLAGGRA
jgi:hypothetical protein